MNGASPLKNNDLSRSKRSGLGQSLRVLSFRRPKDRNNEFGGMGEIKEGASITGKDLRAFADDAEERYKAINKSKENLVEESGQQTRKPVRKPVFRQPSLKLFLSKNKSPTRRSKKNRGSVCSAPNTERKKKIPSGCRSLRTMVNEYEDIVGEF